MNLIVVESPTKAKTLAKFLGDGYRIEASMGHIRDLPEKRLGIEIEKDFELSYVQTVKQKERTKQIKEIAAKANKIILASDPDREGEAIAWHIATLLKSQTTNPKFQRVTFHEITKSAIENALKNPGEINMQLVDAQQARRVLDRLVGYKLSPLLWKKVRKGLSAGRVQSVAVRLVADRENEIKDFKSEEYWEIFTILKSQDSNFKLKLDEEIKDKTEADEVEKELVGSEFIVQSIEKKDFKRTPPAPFTTSVLQQVAANKMGWSAKRTIQVAQSLYEKGLITYHRTDSTNIADEATAAAREFIIKNYGQNYALDKPRIYKTKNKVAQEAHEAIRPTEVNNQSSIINDQLNRDEEKLYELIWKRFVACQMAEVLGETTKIIVSTDKHKLEARGEVIKFDGWHKLNGDSDRDSEERLPELRIGEELNFVSLEKLQKFTQGPARYNDASLIKALEELGIGRPSTYAPTLSTIADRQYVEKNLEKRYQLTSLGEAVNTFLTTNFADIFDYKFTAKMEEELDEVANGEKKWQPVIHDFWDPFSIKLKSVEETSERVKVEVEATGEKCPKCKDGEVLVRLGKFGKFLACSKFPDCDYKANWQNKTGQKCEKCKIGDVIIRKTRTGRNFYGCSNYPKCDFASWNKPTFRSEVKTQS